IGIFDPSYSGENPQALRRLAKATGGRAYFPETVSEVSEATEQIAREIRQQYTIGYIPSRRTPEGQYRTIRVTAKASGLGKLRVRTRAGYLIPSERRISSISTDIMRPVEPRCSRDISSLTGKPKHCPPPVGLRSLPLAS